MRARLTRLAVLLLLAGLGLWWLLRDSTGARPESSAVLTPATAPAPTLSAERAPGPGPGEADDGMATGARSGQLDAGATTPLASASTDAGARAEALSVLRDFLRANAAAAERYVDRYCEEARPLAAARAFAPAPRSWGSW